MYSSGIEPVVVGLAMGLVTYAYPAGRGDLERASEVFRLFREQPTPELAREAQAGVAAAVSPNERLARSFHPWTSYLIVPLFALSNAGVVINGGVLARAFSSPITLGILFGYVLGKPVGIAAGANLVRVISRGRLRPPVGWASLTGAGAIAGIGFTVSLLISTLAFTGDDLEEAKIGVLTAALAAALLSWLVFRATAMLPRRLRVPALIGTADSIIDLAVPVDPDRDHIRGPRDSLVTIVEYGDFECPYCGRAEPVVRELLADYGDVRYIFRHLPLTDVHPHAQLAAESAEAAAAQGRFWEMHDALFDHQDALRPPDLLRHAGELGLNVEAFREHLRKRAGAGRIAEDVDSADLSGVSGTPTFFINGLRHRGAFDIGSLTAAVHTAKARALVDARGRAS
jgi:protein-disulfide isomerase